MKVIPRFAITGPALRSGSHLNLIVDAINKAPQILSNSVAAVGSGTSTTTQTMLSYSIPANTLSVVGDAVEVFAWGTFAGNADSKTLGLAIGGAKIASGAFTTSGSSWTLSSRYTLTGSSAESAVFNGQVGATVLNPSVVSDTSSNGAAINVVLSALTTGTASDVVAAGMTVKFAP